MNKLCFFLIVLINYSCKKDNDSEKTRCDQSHTKRIGAVCKDGTQSNATGSGACSNQGGVDYWLCE